MLANHFAANHDLARLLVKRQRYWEAAPHYERAIAAQPGGVNRYEAAACAAQAATAEAAPLTNAQRAHWRRQALTWLRAEFLDLNQRAAAGVAGEPPAAEVLAKWLSEPRLASVRSADALVLLPEDEQGEWRALWADVAAAAPK